MTPLQDSPRQEWCTAVDDKVPPELAPWFSDTNASDLYVHRPPNPTRPLGVWTVASRSALKGSIDPDGLRLLVWIDDRPPIRDSKELRQAWRGFLRLFHHWRPLRFAFFVGTEAAKQDYRFAAALGRLAPEQESTAWDALDVDPEYAFLVDILRNLDVPLPEVGQDILNHKGHTLGVEAELLWEAQQLAVVESLDDLEGSLPTGWTVLELPDLQADPTPFETALANAFGAS
jgi:hypothetical protein